MAITAMELQFNRRCEMNPTAIDALVPLGKASFRDAVAIGVDTPMRYAECYITLADGDRVRLRDRSQFLGWSGSSRRRSYYFVCGDKILRIGTNAARRNIVRSVDVWQGAEMCRANSSADSRVGALGGCVHKITTVDGSLLFVAPRTASRPERSRTHRYPTAELETLEPAAAAIGAG